MHLKNLLDLIIRTYVLLDVPKKSLRENLLQAGVERMWRSGYAGASVRDLVAVAHAPQGSFTNHFRSKEDFACEVLERYFEYVRRLVLDDLKDARVSPLDRLKRYFATVTGKLGEASYERGCLAGNLAIEASPESEPIRLRLAEIFKEWTAAFTACVAEAQTKGEIKSDLSAEQLAEFLINSWQGAMLRMKIDRNERALDAFNSVIFSIVMRKEINERQ